MPSFCETLIVGLELDLPSVHEGSTSAEARKLSPSACWNLLWPFLRGTHHCYQTWGEKIGGSSRVIVHASLFHSFSSSNYRSFPQISPSKISSAARMSRGSLMWFSRDSEMIRDQHDSLVKDFEFCGALKVRFVRLINTFLLYPRMNVLSVPLARGSYRGLGSI